MSLTALFLSLCIQTPQLNCNQISVELAELDYGIDGQSLLYSNGQTTIQIDQTLPPNGRKIKETILHELAHVWSFRTDMSRGKTPTASHTKTWFRLCKKVSINANMMSLHCQLYMDK